MNKKTECSECGERIKMVAIQVGTKTLCATCANQALAEYKAIKNKELKNETL